MWGFPGGSAVKNLPAVQEPQETQVRSLGWEDSLQQRMAVHSSLLAWRTRWTEEPGRLQSSGWERVGYSWHDLSHMHALIYPSTSAFVAGLHQNRAQGKGKILIQSAGIHLTVKKIAKRNMSWERGEVFKRRWPLLYKPQQTQLIAQQIQLLKITGCFGTEKLF